MSEISPLFGDVVSSPVPANNPASPVVAPSVVTPSPVMAPPAMGNGLAKLPSDTDLDALSQSYKGGYASVSEKLLATHKASDAGDMGQQLNTLLLTAKGLNPAEQHSLVGKLMTRIRGEKEQILAHTQSVKGRLAELEKNMEATASVQRQRIQDIEGLKHENAMTAQKIQTAQQRAIEWEAQVSRTLATYTPDAQDPQSAAKLQEYKHLDTRLQVTIEDLKNYLVLNSQQAVELQSTQDNSRAILDEFDRARNIAIPALTQLVAQQLIAIEQQSALKTQAAVRDMVNNAMTQAATTLGQNQVAISTMQQTSMISVDTLTQCQDILDEAANKVKAIEQQGAQQRQLDAQKREELQRRLMAS